MKDFLEKLNIKTSINYEKFVDIYTVNLKATNLPFESFGKGLTLEDALNSAYGEMCERVLTRNFLEEYYINNLYKDAIIAPKILNTHLYEFYNIKSLHKEDLFDFNSDVFDILSIPFINNKTQKTTYFPINIIHNLYASNGMAYHKDKNIAYYNAKCEIIERFVKFEVVRYALPLPKISHQINNDFLQVYDATLDGKYPVMAVSFIDNKDIILAFGADLDKEVAIKKAYLELLQTGLRRRGKIIDDIESVRSPINLINHFIDLSGDIHANFLKKPYFKEAKWNFKDLDVFKEDEYIRVYQNAVQIIIPSISEIYPIDDLLYNNINKGKFIRNDILKRKNYQKAMDYCYEHGAWDIGAFIGVIFDKNYKIHDLEKLYEDGYEYSQKYLNLLNLAKALNEI